MRQENAPRPALRRPLLGLLTLSLLAAPAALAQTADPVMPPAPAPVTTEPTPTAPVTAPTPPETAPSDAPAADTAPAETTPTDAPPADAAPTETAPNDAVPAGDATSSGLPATGSVTVPKLDGEELLKTVPTVLGEALIYKGDAEDALARTAQALVAEGYQATEGAAPTADAAGVTTLTLTKDDQQFQLTQRSSMGLTVVALARLPESSTPAAPAPATDAAPADAAPSAEPADAAPAESAPADTAPTAPAPSEPAPGEPARTEPVTPPAPVTPPSQP